jgi:hypothetical protein
MKSRIILSFCLLCVSGLAGFADDSAWQCRDDSRIVCRDQSSTPVTYNNQDFQNQQNQLNQRGTCPPSAPQVYQPAYNCLNFSQQNIQAMLPQRNAYTPDINYFEQQQAAVNTVNQMKFAAATYPTRDFSRAVPVEDPRELSRKIKEAAQSETNVKNDNFTDSFAK